MESNEISTSTEVAIANPQATSAFSNGANFEVAQRMAKALSSTDLVPTAYKGNVANCLLALEVAQRTGASPMAVMQNLHIVQGRPTWSASFIIAAMNSCGRFTPMKFRVTGEGDARECVAYTTDVATGEEIEGPPVTIGMAKKEGWFGKTGSKWQTMPDLMLRYRAAAFFGRLYAPDILMGMHADDEVQDVHGRTVKRMRVVNPAPTAIEKINAKVAKVSTQSTKSPVSEQDHNFV
jgi:hypothetical protein